MSVPRTHILRQTPVIAALVRAAAVAAARRAGFPPGKLVLPGPTLTATVSPRPPRLVKDYLRTLGADASWYRGVLPPHLFPQWSFPLLSRTLTDIPYDMTRVLNGGCRMEMNAPLSAASPLHLRANLEDIDDDGRRAVLHQRVITGTDTEPDALVCHLYSIVPLKREGGGRKKERPRVPTDAREVTRWRLTPQTAWAFAVLTGDFNPVHWVPAYARAAGFKNTILHGFATLALSVEALNKVRFAGNPDRLAAIDVRFTRPLVLPAKVSLFLDDRGGLFVGSAPGGPANLTGTKETRDG